MTQKFVTLPREVVDQAIAALTDLAGLRAAPLCDLLRAALEQPQVVRETAPDGATHIQPQQGAFYKRVDEKWYVWSRMEDGRPHRWYISPGTVESCLKPISAATERLQNHVPDAWNMVPAGWKLVPVEPTCGMVLAGEHSMKQHDFFRLDAGYRAMLAAAPQPQGEQEICCKIWSVNRIDDLGKIVDSSGRLIATVYGSQADKIVACHNSYTHPQPKREPLTVEQIAAATGAKPGTPMWLVAVAFTRAIEAAHDIK